MSKSKGKIEDDLSGKGKGKIDGKGKGKNEDPNANDDNSTVNEDGSVRIDVLANDNAPDGDTILIQSFSQPTNGTVTLNGDGTLQYTPDPDFNGTETFTYTIFDSNGATDTATVTVTVNPANDQPIAVSDSRNVTEDSSVDINVVANDSDPDGDPLSISSFTQPSNGTVTLNPNGTLKYTPDPDFNGTDSFTYTISDGNGGTDTATVDLTVDPAKDDPIAVNDSRTVNEDGFVDINVLQNDSDPDGDPLTLDSFTQPSNGTVTLNPNGTLKYTPDPDFNGTDSFTYTISDGNGGTDTATVSLTVDPTNDDPIAVNDNETGTVKGAPIDVDVLANDIDVDGDTLSLGGFGQPTNGTVTQNPDGTLRYTPDPDFVGTDTFTYTVSDGNGGTDTGTVQVVVPCFTPGTMIATPDGDTAVENLAVGDRVVTRDNGVQRIEWIGVRKVKSDELKANRNWLPVRIEKGALGENFPSKDLLVSPQHRMMVHSKAAQLNFGSSEVLVAAKALTFLRGVDIARVEHITYIHIMFAEHQLVFSNGTWSESFLPGDLSLAGMDEDQREELVSLFPNKFGRGALTDFASARPTVKPWDAKVLFDQ